MRSDESSSNSLISGTINFTDTTTLSGSFQFQDSNSSTSVEGVKGNIILLSFTGLVKFWILESFHSRIIY